MFQSKQQIGPYILIERIGRGGFGEVWLAERQTKFVPMKVAVKLPHADQVDHEAIKRETTLWEQAKGHPNILPIIDADEYEGQIVIVSEYAPEGSLEGWLKKNGKMPVHQAIETTKQILEGLEFLHSRNIIHRDLKPANVLLQGNTPRLADFGISRALGSITTSGPNITGTQEYMAPEAFDNKRTIQTDIWSVGVTLYKLMTGTLPFQEKEASLLLSAILRRKPKPLPDFVPTGLKKIVWTALSKQPKNRYKTASEMREALRFELQKLDREASLSFSGFVKRILRKLPTKGTSEFRETKERIEGEVSESETIPQNPPTIAKTNRTSLKRNAHYFLITGTVVLMLMLVLSGGYILKHQVLQTKNISVTPTPPQASTDSALIPFRKGDKWGYSTRDKKLVIPLTFDDARQFSEGLAAFEINGRWGFIDTTGRQVVPPKYESVFPFFKGLSRVYLKPRCQLIDKAGTEIIPSLYDSNCEVSEGLIEVWQNYAHGFIDTTGKVVVQLTYESAFGFSEGLAQVKLNGKWGFVNKSGKLIAEPTFDKARQFREGRAVVGINNKYGFINTSGAAITDLRYDGVDDFLEGFAVVRMEKRFGYVDRSGAETIHPQYEDAAPFINGLARVKRRGKFGYIDKKGHEVIPMRYDYAGADSSSYILRSYLTDGRLAGERGVFSEGLIRIQENGRWGFVDTNGKVIIKPRYNFVGHFSEGFALIEVDSKWGFINKEGKKIVDLKYERAEPFQQGLALVKYMGRWGFIDGTGKELIPLKYDAVDSSGTSGRAPWELWGKPIIFLDDLSWVWLGDKRFYLDRNATEFYEP